MTTTTFDTLAYAKKLRDAGIPEPQAEAQATALADALATTLAQFKNEMHIDELATRRDLAELKVDLLKWIIGLLLAQTGLIAALVKLL
jgi:ApbE superfamily uncharacterized protein (UPF0280 family)